MFHHDHIILVNPTFQIFHIVILPQSLSCVMDFDPAVAICELVYTTVYCSIQDKTFGLKNKKGKKQQQFVKQVTNQVKYGGGTSIQKVNDRRDVSTFTFTYIFIFQREELERKEKVSIYK